MKNKRKICLCLAVQLISFAILYGGGYAAQFIKNYKIWTSAGGTPGSSSPVKPALNAIACFKAAFSFPYGIIGCGICITAVLLLVFCLFRMGRSDGGVPDKERNFVYSNKGTYGTSGFMSEKEMKTVFDLTHDLKNCSDTVLGLYDGKYICVPQNGRLNKNIAVYGASGSMKTRAFCINRILQAVQGGESLIICDPKSELYEKTSEYLRRKNYTVRVFNLVSPENSDSWNCLEEIQGDELMAQLFCDVIIKNTGSERGDHFWDSSEMNLLKALVLYVEQGYPAERKNMGEVYKLLTLSSDKELNSLFDMLPPSHPAKAPYSIYRQASDTVRTGVIIGLGSRLQVFQMKKASERRGPVTGILCIGLLVNTRVKSTKILCYYVVVLNTSCSATLPRYCKLPEPPLYRNLLLYMYI